ncbi:hypothetical protein [Rouxiella chamberiensis]|uniref:Rha family transcriptional regulator n=1 Tax=Rouxiella chamberiensis TaxID=1513468 RepID=A0ABY7HQB9_9GAMM|nr:hypothetical protein [Rouxiella chamberiensis]WAT01021.1 hypothetical protein O1V66_20010 [Rouxiella chamberiensis]
MLLADDKQREIGIKHISKIKEMLAFKKNVAQETFDESPLHMRKTICFHAGLKARHINAKFSELSYTERLQVVAALNSLIDFAGTLPRFVSKDDCKTNSNH